MKPAAFLLRTFLWGFCCGFGEVFKRKGQKDREFFGWTDRLAREQERQANGKVNILSYTT